MIPEECILKPGETVDVFKEHTSKVVSSYKVIKKIGEGGFGVVYLVKSKSTDKPYALKVLKLWLLKKSEQDNYRKRFNRAYKVMSTPSEHLVHSVDYGEINGNPFYVMEYCPNGDLLDYFDSVNKRDRETEVVRCMYQVLLGLNELHSQGMVHRDIKPENVMLRSDGTIVLNDFDLAGDENNRFTTQYFMGIPKQSFYTKAFAPPEQVNPIRGHKEVMVMPTIDIFAFAVMCYKLLIGSFPFGSIRTDSDMAVYYAHVNNDDWDREALKKTNNASFWESVLEPCLKGDYQKRLGDINHLIIQFESQFPDICKVKERFYPPSNTDDYALEVVYGETSGEKIKLDTYKGLLQMGRNTSDVQNDIELHDDAKHYVSRRHATMEWDNNSKHWFIRDGQFDKTRRSWNRSKNGTYVNSREIDDRNGVALNLGDMIYIGDMRLKVIDATGLKW